MQRFEDYLLAVAEAKYQANTYNLRVCIRKQKEFGRTGYNLSFHDDYSCHNCEVIRPHDAKYSSGCIHRRCAFQCRVSDEIDEVIRSNGNW